MSNKEQNKAVSSLDKKLEKETAANKKVNEIYALDPELHGKTRLQATAQEIGLALLSVVVGSLATVSIMIPNGLTFGGITGISRIIQNYTNWNYSLTYYALSLIITAIVWAFLGFKEVRKILLMSLAYPAFMLVLELNHVVLIESDDLFLVAVFCGVVLGVSNGLTFKAGFSSGGTDSLAKVIKYRWFPHLGDKRYHFRHKCSYRDGERICIRTSDRAVRSDNHLRFNESGRDGDVRLQ